MDEFKSMQFARKNSACSQAQVHEEIKKPENINMLEEGEGEKNQSVLGRPMDEEAFLEKYSGRGECDPLENFPLIYSSVPHPVASHISEIARTKELFEPGCSADHSFAWFLFHIAQKANPEIFSSVLAIVLAFRECINNHGLTIFSRFSHESGDCSVLSSLRTHLGPCQPQVKLTAINRADYIFLCADFFLSQQLPFLFGCARSEFATDLLFLMNQWMVDRCLSKVSLKSN